MNHTAPAPGILIVDDNRNDHGRFEHLLRQAGVTNPLRFAGSGAVAISYLQRLLLDRRHLAGQQLAVVLLAVRIPLPDGFSILRWIREREIFSRTRMILLSRSALPSDFRQAEELRADAYLLKHPKVDLAEFLRREVIPMCQSGLPPHSRRR